MNPNKHSIQHTQAEIARRLANDTDDPLRKRILRRTTREKLGGHTSRISEYDLQTRARLAIDEFKELSTSLDTPATALVKAAKETETAIQHGLQMFPKSSGLLTAEATFRECLDQTDRALQALERAFKLNPRQDWLAVRLARKYQASGDVAKSKNVLETCLQDNPSSKLAHFEIGRVAPPGRPALACRAYPEPSPYRGADVPSRPPPCSAYPGTACPHASQNAGCSASCSPASLRAPLLGGR